MAITSSTNTAQKPKSPSKTAATEDIQDVWICLPGENIECHRTKSKVRVTLRKHRDVFFDLNLKPGATYTVESDADFYSPRDKKLSKKAEFADGEHFNVWVGREFKGNLVLKTKGTTMGTYEVNQLDMRSYGPDPKTKPEPLMVAMGKKDASALICKPDDPFNFGSTQQLFQPWFDPKLSMLKDYGSEFDYIFRPEPPEVNEYVAVTEALSQEIQPQVLKQLESGVAVTGSPSQIFVEPRPNQSPSLLDKALVTTAEFITGNFFKETGGYIIENFKNLNKITMWVRIEKKVKGKYKVLLKGRPITMRVKQALTGVKTAKDVHQSMALGSDASKFIDGGFGKTGKAGYGGFKRIMLTTAQNLKGGVKIQALGTVIDLILDVNDVYFAENGSKDLSEFLGRAGVSIIKAGATAVLGSFLAAGAVSVLFGAAAVGAAPVIVVVALVVAGFWAAATFVDWVDDELKIKKRAAALAR